MLFFIEKLFRRKLSSVWKVSPDHYGRVRMQAAVSQKDRERDGQGQRESRMEIDSCRGSGMASSLQWLSPHNC